MSAAPAAVGPTATFRHGVHPPERKDATASLAIERMPFVATYVLPLGQHIGAPAKAIVSPGQRVQRGALLAEPGGFVSTALHAPVTGTVRAIELRPTAQGKQAPCVVLDCDPFDSQRAVAAAAPPPSERDAAIRAIQRAGLVGLGGAAFPSHVKLALPEGKAAHTLLLNGCECEPYLTCDHRLMVERPEALLRGTRLLLGWLGASRAVIGVEANKPDAIAALRRAAEAEAEASGLPAVEVAALTVKYPQGAEKMLIDAVMGVEVPSGRLPIDIGVVVQNVGTVVALADLFDRGQPLIERVVTVTGPGVRRPANVLVPIGTPLRALLDHCGGLDPRARRVVLGGPMMGMTQKDLDVPVTKGVSGVLALIDEAPGLVEEACIRCGRCLEACPMRLNPQRLALLVRHERIDDAKALHILDCFECASCSFVCPSRLPLVQLMRVGKAMVRQKAAA
jgi:electron transport complex protein RnfC